MAYVWPDELKFLANRNAPQKAFTENMAGKVCVITGATSGVGLEAAKSLASHGASLVLIVRSASKAEAVREEIRKKWQVPVSIILADFTDLDHVRRAAADVIRDYPRIDVLINCAGMHSTRRTVTPAGHETVFCEIGRAHV